MLRFHISLIEPDVPNEGIRLSDGLHRPTHRYARQRTFRRPVQLLPRPPNRWCWGCETSRSIPWLLVASRAHPKSGPFPPPALPGFPGTTNLSATPRRPGLSLAGVRLGAPSSHRWGFPCCLSIPLAHMPSPLPRQDRSSRVAHNSTSGGLPRRSGRSAPALRVSRSARRSLALWPACPLTPERSRFLECFSPSRYLLEPLQVLPAGATSYRAGFAPARINTPLHGTRRVEMWRGGFRWGLSVTRPFVCGCLTSSTMLRFHISLIEPDVPN